MNFREAKKFTINKVMNEISPLLELTLYEISWDNLFPISKRASKGKWDSLRIIYSHSNFLGICFWTRKHNHKTGKTSTTAGYVKLYFKTLKWMLLNNIITLKKFSWKVEIKEWNLAWWRNDLVSVYKTPDHKPLLHEIRRFKLSERAFVLAVKQAIR